MLVAVAVVALSGGACGGDDEPKHLTREGSKEIDARFAFGEATTEYRVTYRVRAASADGVATSTEEISVSRPFESRVVVRADGVVTARRVSRFGELVIEGDGGVQVLGVPPALGTSDVRPDAVLDDAVARGMAERGEVREVAGRRCRVYRVGSSASDGTLVPVNTTGGTHADVCVDAGGIVLEEWWVQQGEALRHRLAVDVEPDDVVLDDGTFTLPDEKPPGPTQGGVVAAPGPSFEPPPGFTAVGRYEVTAAQLQQPGSNEILPGRTSLAEVWRRGADLLVLEEARGELPPTPYGIPIDVAGVGPAELVLDLRASELRFTTAGGDTVRLYGTVPPTELLELAASLIGRQSASRVFGYDATPKVASGRSQSGIKSWRASA